MGQIDDAHDAEYDRQTTGHQKQHQAVLNPVQCLNQEECHVHIEHALSWLTTNNPVQARLKTTRPSPADPAFPCSVAREGFDLSGLQIAALAGVDHGFTGSADHD